MTKQTHTDLSKPVLREPIHRDRLIELLYETAEQLYPPRTRNQETEDWGQKNDHTKALRKVQVRYNALRSTIAEFEKFLTQAQMSEVTIDEQLIQDFHDHLPVSKTDDPDRDSRSRCAQIRKLVNNLPSSMRHRGLMSVVGHNQAHRFDSFTEETQKALNDFLKNGRKLKAKSTYRSPELSNELLSETFRQELVTATLTFLKRIDAKDILKLTPDDVEDFVDQYEEEDKEQVALNALDYINPLFANLRAKGLIKNDLLADIPRRKSNEDHDYVPQQGIDKLADLSTVAMHDFMEVRDRLITFTMYYDLACRNKEGSLVEVPDLRLSDMTGLFLRKEIQKIKKEDSLLYSYFPEVSRPLLERYLELRARKNPGTDILLISEKGLPLGSCGCRDAVKAHCDKLGVKTYEGKTPTPHRLRHSFGTLNINPLGRCLDLTEVRDQLRHASIETTDRIYNTKNPILKENRYRARMKANGNGVGQSSKVAQTTHTPSPPPPSEPIQDNTIPENDAIRQVRGLGLNYRSLRQYALKTGKAQKNGREHFYSASFISDLVTNYFTRQEAIDLLNIAPATFFDWTKREGIEFIQIGQVGLFKKAVVLAKKRAA